MKTIKYLSNINVTLKLISSDKDYELMTSMISRLFVGAIEFLNDEDYINTADSGLIPVTLEYYKIKDVVLWILFL